MKTFIKPLILLVMIGLLFGFREPLLEAVNALWTLEPETRVRLKDWLDILTKGGGILGAMWLGWKLFWKGSGENPAKSVTIVDPPQISVDSSESLKSYYQGLRKVCERIDLSLVDTKFTEYARRVEGRITLPVVYQEMEALPRLREKGGLDRGRGQDASARTGTKVIDPALCRGKIPACCRARRPGLGQEHVPGQSGLADRGQPSR